MENQEGNSAITVNDKKMAQTKAQVNEVVNIMRLNVDKVLKRDEQLSELNNRADALQEGATHFVKNAEKLKKKYWWQNLKMMLIIGVLTGIVLIIIIASTVPSGSSQVVSSTIAPNAGL